MALSTAEIQRIKFELGFNQLTVNSEPFIGHAALFEIVIQPFMQSGALTTSSSAVVAASPAAVAAVTLASATGFTVGDRLVIDVDDAQEIATLRSIAGSVASLYLTKAHAGTYPVSVEGGEVIVRQILTQLRQFSEPNGLIQKTAKSAGVTKADEISFSDKVATSRSREMRKLQAYWRDELASAIGVENTRGSSGGSTVAVY